MVDQSKNSVKISGAGTSPGGSFDSVVINGSGRISGALECISFVTNGSSSVDGAIRAEEATINGTTSIRGGATGDRYEVNGSMLVEGDMSGTRLRVSGSLAVRGSLSAEEIVTRGSLHVDRNCDAEQFKVEGAFHIKGLLNADQIDVKLDGQSEAKEIGGETIRILAKRREKINWFMRMLRQSGLEADTIEGDQVELEYTKASVVRGKSVWIGSGCEIGLVEVEGDYRAAEDARVAEVRRIGGEQ